MNVDKKAKHMTFFVKVCHSAIDLQLGLLEKRPLPDDDFSKGYVWGFVDGALQASNLDEDEQEELWLAVGAVLFKEWYGNDGPDQLRKTLHEQATNYLIQLGTRIGGEEAFEFCSKGKNGRVPNFLAAYISPK
ncbi:MAG: hypothetical protein VX640_04260 [Pseudomonadota bacterium]|nr:hypothetical protein [Pseudomonadota bacterium]